MAKIFDCFTFFNELDLLDLRLKELSPHVDHFVIVEATKTFQKKTKPLFFEKNKARFSKYNDKIIHIVVDKYPTFFTKWRVPRTWHYENSQREQILDGLKSAADNDIVVISDIDEIPAPQKLQEIQPGKINIFELYLCYFYFDYFAVTSNASEFPIPFKMWNGPVAVRKKDITTIKKTRELRGRVTADMNLIEKSGWHFSYLGGVDSVVEKLKAFSHKEFNTPEFLDKNKILKSIEAGQFFLEPNTKLKKIELESHKDLFPKTLVAEKNHYAQYFKK